jgi:allantoinase
MSTGARAIRSRRVVTLRGVEAAQVIVRAGKIERLAAWDEEEETPGAIVDCGNEVVMAGLVDTHVHVNEPGRAEWEGFETATRAAAAGGVTTIVDMPLNSVPATTNVDALLRKKEAAAGKCHVDVGFWGGVVPGNARQLAPLLDEGVLGFKCFLVPSGVDEFAPVGAAELRSAIPELLARDAVLLVHAELPEPIEAAASVWEEGGLEKSRSYQRYLRSRPERAEVAAVELVVRLARETGCRAHIVHVSSAAVLSLLGAARNQGVRITAETCPHYLTFCAEEIPDGGVVYKCAPPIRSRPNREELWVALRQQILDMVASDHSPCPPALKELKSGSLRSAWGGIASLELGLAAVWTGARQRGLGIPDVARLMCSAPASLAGLVGRKGEIVPGYDADLVVWDPESSFVVDPERLEQRHRMTPYAGIELFGVVRQTWLRGEPMVRGAPPRGSFLGPRA